MTAVYRYGLPAPDVNADVVLDQMRRAHDYCRDLVFIERSRRVAESEIRRDSSAELREREAAVREAEERCETHAQAIRQERKRSRKRTETEALRQLLAQARLDAKAARAALYETRQAFAPQCLDCRKMKSEIMPCPHVSDAAKALRLALDLLDERASELCRGARKLSGLYWGTYLVVEQAARASFAAALYEKDGITLHQPKIPPRHWPGTGAVAIHIQGEPLSVADATSIGNASIKITPPLWGEEFLDQNPVGPPGTASAPSRGYLPNGMTPASPVRVDGTPARWVHDGAARHGRLRMRVGLDGEMAEWRLDYHRPLPKDATVTWATVHRRMRGPIPEWSLCVTIDGGLQREAPERNAATVAINFGWRQIDRELRVASWQDSVGTVGELRLTEKDIRALRQCEEIRSQRSMAFDLIIAKLRRWVSTSGSVPACLQEAAPHLHAWRSQARLVSLLDRWLVERPVPSGAPEAVIRAAVEAWAQADRAAWITEEARRIWSLRRRRAKYREFAATIASRYTTIVWDKTDLREFATRKPTGEDSAENEQARSNRQLACVSDLRSDIVNACRTRGSMLAAMPPANVTRTCPNCGVVEDRDAAAKVRLACETCTHAWDQDTEGAAKVLLDRYRERPGDAKMLVGARTDANDGSGKEKSVERWARARRMSKAKKARLESAREAAAKTAE
jgi:hypothetical protein